MYRLQYTDCIAVYNTLGKILMLMAIYAVCTITMYAYVACIGEKFAVVYFYTWIHTAALSSPDCGCNATSTTSTSQFDGSCLYAGPTFDHHCNIIIQESPAIAD